MLLFFWHAYLTQTLKQFQIYRDEGEAEEDVDIDRYFAGKLLLILQQ